MQAFANRFVIVFVSLATLFNATSALAQAPVVVNNSFSTLPGVADYVYLNLSTTDPTGQGGYYLKYSVVKQPAHGIVVFTYSPQFTYSCTYICPTNYAGPDPFTWTAANGAQVSGIATCSVTVLPDTIPTANACSFTNQSGKIATNAMSCTDPDSGQILTAIVTTQPANGIAYPSPNGGVYLVYCASPGFAGTDTFSFAISDGAAVSAPATCTMVVTSSPPVALAQTVVTMKNTPITIPLSYSGGGGYTCWPVKVTAPVFSGALNTNNNVFVYTPPANWVSPAATPDSFTWQMSYKTNGGSALLSAVVKCSIVVKDTGGSSDWTQWEFDECRTAQSPGTLPGKLALQWRRALPPNTGAGQFSTPNDMDWCRPVQMGKQLFVGLLANDSVSAYNTDTGAQNWRYYAGGALRRPPLALTLPNGTNVVIFGCDDGCLYCLNAQDGSEVWKYRLAPNAKKAMGFGRLSSCWPIFASPVAYSNRVYAAAGFVRTWNLIGCCLDAASGTNIWLQPIFGHGYNNAMGPLSLSANHGWLYGSMDTKAEGPWVVNVTNGHWVGNAIGGPLGYTGTTGAYADNWFIGGNGIDASSAPLTITAGGQVFNPITVAGLGVPGTVGSLLAGDSKLFVSTLDGNLYCFGTNVVQTNFYAATVTPLTPTNDTWTTVVQSILTNRPDLAQGLALVWGVGSGRLVTELAQQAPGLTIVAADPDPAKLRAIRTSMDAAGWSGAHVSTLQGNPMDCGFAPYQAALIVSEDAAVAGMSNGAAMVKMLYKCTRPYGGQVWLPTNDVADIASWLSAANLPTCGGGVSYQVIATSIAGQSFVCMQRLGLPEASLALKPPFRLTAFGPSTCTDSSFPSLPVACGNTPVKGAFGGYDLYSWLPVSAAFPGYEPPAPASNNAVATTANASAPEGALELFRGGGGVAYPMTNALYNFLDFWPRMHSISAPDSGASGNGITPFTGCSSNRRVYNSTILNGGKVGWIADASNYWGFLPFTEIGACGGSPGQEFAGDGMVAYAGSLSGHCVCNSPQMYMQFGCVPTDATDNEEQWVLYSESRSMRRVLELPVYSVGVNFGAPGDHWDDLDQVLWTHWPFAAKWYNNGSMDNHPLIPVRFSGGMTNIYHYSGAMKATNSNYHGWVTASHVEGMTNLTLPLAQPLVAARGTPALPLTGTLDDACWGSCTQIDISTGCNYPGPPDQSIGSVVTVDRRIGSSGDHCSFKICYDATNLYVAGIFHQAAPRSPLLPVNMRVALGDRRSTPVVIWFGEASTSGGVTPWTTNASIGLPTNAWTAAFKTNTEIFTGELCVPWTNLVSAGIWTSQLVMGVEICGNIFNYGGSWGTAGGYDRNSFYSFNNLATIDVASHLSPVYLDVARGPDTQVIPRTVRLYFAETEGLTNGQRVFDVFLQGQKVLTNFDVYAAAGAYNDVMREFPNIGVSQNLNIGFVPQTGPAMLSGIEIKATGGNAPNQAPVAFVDANVTTGSAPLTVDFSAQRSYDPDGQIVECGWDTGDGRVAHGGPNLHHVFAEPGTYNVSLLVLDNDGATAATNILVTVTPGVPAAFICNIRPNNAVNPVGDYTGINAMGVSLVGDLTSSTMVFQVSSKGTIVANDTFWNVTFTGGKTGILRWVRSDVTSGVTTMSAAVAYVGGTGTLAVGTATANGHTFTISDTGVLTKSLLFTVSGLGNYASATDDNSLVTFSGGGLGILRHINHASPNIAYISECRGTILPGSVTCASGDTFAVLDSGNPIVTLVAQGYKDWQASDTYNTAVNPSLPLGWVTDPNHCVVIRAASGQGHTGCLKTNGAYTGYAIIYNNGFVLSDAPYTRVNQLIVDGPTLQVGVGCSVNHVLGSVILTIPYIVALPSYFTTSVTGVTIANSIAPMLNTIAGGYGSSDIDLFNCTAGSFLLGNLNASPVEGTMVRKTRAINCLAYSNTVGFAPNPASEIWLNHCVSRDASANNWDAWKEGNVGNVGNQTVTFAAAGNYLLATNDAGARGLGQPGLGTDILGNMRTGPSYDVGAHQTTNALITLSAFQQWQLACYGSTTAPNAASNAVTSAGVSNWQMFLAGSNPFNSNTWFRFTGVAPIGNHWGMNFNTVTGKSYSVKWKTNLLDGLGWVFYTNFSGLGGSTQVIFTNALPQAFFQIQAQ